MRPDPPAANDQVDAWLAHEDAREWLRVVTCGGVDDGKSTLMGRLLYETRRLHADEIARVALDSRRFGTCGAAPDMALLLDGLAAEREQGITIDVGHRSLVTARRRIELADAPGHAQYTRNLVTGASVADVAVVLVDVRRGLLPQTRRHLLLVALLGIRRVLLAVNKMDLVDFDRGAFEPVRDACAEFARRAGGAIATAVPLAALHGDNLVERSRRTPWYDGPTLLDYLDGVDLARDEADQPFRFPVQTVVRGGADFRGLAGTVVAGAVRPGDRVRVLPSGRESRIARLVAAGSDLQAAEAGQSATIVLEDALDVGRGDLLCDAHRPACCADQLRATVIWMADQPLLAGRQFLAKFGPRTVGATVTRLRHRISTETVDALSADRLEVDQVGVCNLALAEPTPFDAYADSRDTGGFLLIDRESLETVGAGLVQFALRRTDNVRPQALAVDRAARAAAKRQRPRVVWFTGLSGAGKSTLADRVEQLLHRRGRHTYLLDGDNLRHGLNRDLGFTAADRVENVRRVAEVAKLMADAGLVVLVSLISPFRADRRLARELLADGEFVEVHVDVPLAEAERRDPKGLYAKARRGELANFTGIDSPYEPPEDPEIRVDAVAESADAAAARIVEWLERGD